MRNLDIRLEVSESGLTYREVAQRMGVSATWLSTLMRYDLSPKNHERIMTAVRELNSQKRDVANG